MMQPTMNKLAIYGAGGFAREVNLIAEEMERHDLLEVVGFVSDNGGPDTLHDKPVLSFDSLREQHPDATIVIAIGDPKTRTTIAAKVANAGMRFARLCDIATRVSRRSAIGEGSIICAGSIITVDVEIGKHVHINLNCTVGHDVKIGDFTTISPGVHVSGNVVIGERVFIGTGANIINGKPGKPLRIDSDAIIAAGATVTSDCGSNALYAGVPAVLKKIYR